MVESDESKNYKFWRFLVIGMYTVFRGDRALHDGEEQNLIT